MGFAHFAGARLGITRLDPSPHRRAACSTVDARRRRGDSVLLESDGGQALRGTLAAATRSPA